MSSVRRKTLPPMTRQERNALRCDDCGHVRIHHNWNGEPGDPCEHVTCPCKSFKEAPPVGDDS